MTTILNTPQSIESSPRFEMQLISSILHNFDLFYFFIYCSEAIKRISLKENECPLKGFKKGPL